MGLGIDFGTTRTVVAFSDRGNYPIVSFEGEGGDALEWFPSVIAERDGELRFGFDALAVAADPSFSQVRSFKRLLAGPAASAAGDVTIGSARLPIAELVAGFLGALRDALRTRSNLPKNLRRAERLEAVVATPANAFCTQRFITLDAFRRAGFDVTAMLNEPSAAGFEYAHRHARTMTSQREHVIVYDLGGGTFDASLVHMSGAHHEVVMTAGLARLGGDDFDRVLAELAARRAGQDIEALGAQAHARLLDQCREAKERLNASSKKITVDLEGEEITLPVADYYDACAPLVDRTLEALRPVALRGGGEGDLAGDALALTRSDDRALALTRSDDRALALTRSDDRALPGDVAGLYVVGGASSLPVVGRVLRARFGRRVHRSPYPHAAVAIGLAIASDAESTLSLDDRFSRNFGVFREAHGGAQATYDAIFTRETPLPRQGEPPVVVRRRYRAVHDLGHFRFFECASFDGEGNPAGDIAPVTDVLFPFDAPLRARDVDLSHVSVRRLDRPGPLVEEEYTVDPQGMIEITFKDLDSGFTKKQVVGAG